VATENQVQLGQLLRERGIGLQGQVGQRDDRIGAVANASDLLPERLRRGAIAQRRAPHLVDGGGHDAEARDASPCIGEAEDEVTGQAQQRPVQRIRHVAGEVREAGFGDAPGQVRVGQVELVVAERGDVEAGRVEHRDHLASRQTLPIDPRGAERRGRHEIAAQEHARVGVLLSQPLQHRGHPRQSTRFAAFDRADLVDIVDVQEGDVDGAIGRRCRCRAGVGGAGGEGNEREQQPMGHALQSFRARSTMSGR